MREGDTFQNFNSTKSFKRFLESMIAIPSTWFIFCNVNVVVKNMWEVPRRNFDKYLMCTNLILGHTHANITQAPLTRVSLFHKPVSLGIFLKMDTMGNSRLGVKLSMGQRTFIHFGERSFIGNIDLKRSHTRALMKERRLWN